MHDYKALLKFQPMATGSACGAWGTGEKEQTGKQLGDALLALQSPLVSRGPV